MSFFRNVVTVRYVFLSLILYGWAIIPFVYVQSFMCKVASTAYVWVTVFNIFSGMYSITWLLLIISDLYCCLVFAVYNHIKDARYMLQVVSVFFSENN